jgi:hypothetical protein
MKYQKPVCFYGALRIWWRTGGRLMFKYVPQLRKPHFYIETQHHMIHYVFNSKTRQKFLKHHATSMRVIQQPIMDIVE